MMRTLAEFVLRGRFQAMVIALVGSLFPLLALLTPVAVGLVTLRKGWQEGALVVGGVSLAVVAVIAVQDLGAFAVYLSVGAILVAYVVATVLRYTASWPAALSAMVAFSFLVSILASVTVSNPSEGLLGLYQSVLDSQPKETREQWVTVVRELDGQLIVGGIAFSFAVYALFGVLIARWWQALLFNPGGLREEFHQLRLNIHLAAACCIGFCYCEWQGDSYLYWQLLIVLPLLMAGLALCHWFVARLKWSVGALVGLYFSLVLFPPILLLALLLGFSDVWLDYRKRFNLMQQ
ncbi:YybS family protein [Teredinibacter purpureus]|jgi:Predicted membrane protein (DUF2232).|uniref:hypothetical protein n=1 Tax=Teredinibacter purpureus TaxID=2731756 RepID=UPI0006980358|nr:hypothetical protein [Teredinibacter purpureus]